MLILLGNGIIQQPISYYHEIYALLSQKVLCPQSKIPFLQPLVVDVRKVNQVGQVGFVWFGLEGSKFQHSHPIWSITKVGIELLGQLKNEKSF